MNQTFLQLIQGNAWSIKIAAVILSGCLAHWLGHTIFKRLLAKLEGTQHLWDKAFIRAASAPYKVFVWLIVFSLILPVIMHEFGLNGAYAQYFSAGREIVFILAVFWFAMRVVSNIEAYMVTHAESGRSKRIRDTTSVRAIGQLLRVLIILVTLLILMQSFGMKVGTLLAFGGIGGIAIGFAAKDTLANFLGGMMIYWDRPFCVGDWIRSPDRNIEGTVEYIGWRLTRILTFDRRPLYVPNGVFSTISVENPSRMKNRRILTTIGLRYRDASKIAVILSDIESMLRAHPEIDTTQTLMVNLIEFGPASLNFFIYTFTKTTNWVAFQSIQQDVFLKAIDIITQHGAECAFPTTTIEVPDGLLLKNAQ